MIGLGVKVRIVLGFTCCDRTVLSGGGLFFTMWMGYMAKWNDQFNICWETVGFVGFN